MSRFLLLLAVAATVLSTSQVPAQQFSSTSKIDGAWKGYYAGNGFRILAVMIVATSEADLTGRMVEAQQGDLILTTLAGGNKGGEITFIKTYSTSSLAGYRFTYTGKVDAKGAHIKGTWTGNYPSPNDTGTFEFTKQ